MTTPGSCPEWCHVRHGDLEGEDDRVHQSSELMVRHTLLRLCATVEAGSGVVDGPYVLLGTEEYTLHEAEALIGALTQLVDQAAAVIPVEA